MTARLSSKAGVTLVELMLASAVAAISILALLAGFITAQRIVHANAEALRADNIAFDLLWRRFYTDYDRLPATGTSVSEQKTDSSTSPYYTSQLTEVPSYSYQEWTAVSNDVKLLSIDVKYGPNDRYTRHLDVFRSDISRVAPSS